MKKIFFLFVINILISNYLFAQIKPIRFGLVFKFDEASFDIKERKIAKYLFDTISITLDKKMDSISKTKSMCVDYVGYKDVNKADLLYVIHIYKGDYDEIKNIPITEQFLMHNDTKDTISAGRLKGTLAEAKLAPEEHSVDSNIIFLEKNISGLTNLVVGNLLLFVLPEYFPNCIDILDYKRQKIHNKAFIFLCNNATVSNIADAKYIKIMDNFVNNQFVTKQLRDEKKKRNRRFVFYPNNKDTKKIKPDITIQLHLQEDAADNYKITVELKGKDVNLRGPNGMEMEKSITFNKKRLDNGDYTEFVYKLNSLISRIYTYNILL